jgi:hypothetical protein
MRRLRADYAAPIAPRAPGPPLAEWLQGLRRLHGVPLGHLVPDTRMLPPESLRFFTLDRGWIDALCDGALSLRATGRADAALRSAAIYAAAAPDPAAPVSGFLLRSVAVWRWPSIDVSAYGYDGQPLDELRCDRPAPDVLLGLYAGTVHEITLAEPAQTLHYGFAEPTDAPKRRARVVDIKTLSSQFASPAELASELLRPGECARFTCEDST